jgi:nucleoside-triphosphatase THEP1
MNPNYLDFEQPIAELEAKIEELRYVGDDTEINIGDEISKLEEKSRTLTQTIFNKLDAWQTFLPIFKSYMAIVRLPMMLPWLVVWRDLKACQ